MRIVTVRRISQIFFLALFIWLGVVATFGVHWWQMRGWPVNWILQLDPLVGFGTALATHTLYWPLLWGLATVALTVVVGRFFCGWLCPFGTMHHFVSFLRLRGKKAVEKIELNKYRKAQGIKYLVLVVFLLMAAVPVGRTLGLQTGLLDPIPLVTRSLHLVLLPIADMYGHSIFVASRYHEGAFAVGIVFFAAIGMNLVIPRFYCRFVCPLGALFGLLGRFAIWRVGKNDKCIGCKVCEKNCHGGCEPAGAIKIPECVLCMNCMDECSHAAMDYSVPGSGSEVLKPDVSRRALFTAGIGGLLLLPVMRLANKVGANWHYGQVRPPGALPEEEFLKRCLKCGQCMRICPTNVIQPAGIEAGVEALWTPVLNNRIGTSGCQLDCTACGYVCPTAAIRPIVLAEKLGVGEFKDAGPIKIGTAFVDQARCLPWAMKKPCIVCQENCPVSPKAIYTEEVFAVVRGGELAVKQASGASIEFENADFKDGQYATGDYYCRSSTGDTSRRKIVANDENSITIEAGKLWEHAPAQGSEMFIEVLLQRPVVDVDACIGCGVCEHECPVSGLRAIRVSAEGESRSEDRRLLLN